MAVWRSTIVFITTVLVFATSISATEYIVGDQSGWTFDFDYQTWAKDKVFYVGDKLVFNYMSGTHNVMKVNGTGFQQCITSSCNGTLTSGQDVIPLQTPGRKWYICGVWCRKALRVEKHEACHHGSTSDIGSGSKPVCISHIAHIHNIWVCVCIV